MDHTDTRTLPPAAQQVLRERVMAAVQGGMRPSEAARIFGVTRQSIYNWTRAVKDRGPAALRARKRGPKVGSRLLAPHQAATTVRMITASCPDQLRLPFALWTREAVCDLVQRKFAVRMSVWTAGRYLKGWGLTPQKPLRRAYERDPVAVRHWLQEQYPAIAAHAKAKKAEIHWGDEMGLRSDHQAGRSYGRRGQTPVIGGTGKRFGCNMISTITNRGSLAFMVFSERFTAAVCIEFLRRLLRHARRPVFLIVDRHPVHESAKVKQWVAARPDRIQMFFLPGYSPELNPDELLNQDVKSNALGRKRPSNKAELMRGVRSYLRSTQGRPELVKRYFQEEHVRYAA